MGSEAGRECAKIERRHKGIERRRWKEKGKGGRDNERNDLSKTIMLNLFMHRAMHLLLAHNTPETNHNPSKTREKRRVVCSLVAAQTIGTVALTVRIKNRMFVVDSAVEQVEDVTAQDGGESHRAPVLREAADAECVCDQRWEDAEEEAIGDACHA